MATGLDTDRAAWQIADKFSGFGTLLFVSGMKSVLGFGRLFTARERAEAEGEMAVSTPVLELSGAYLSIQKWLDLCSRKRVVLGLDAEVAVLGYARGWSPRPEFCLAIRRMQDVAIWLEGELRVYHLPRTSTPIQICDCISRQEMAEAIRLCKATFGVPLEMV